MIRARTTAYLRRAVTQPLIATRLLTYTVIRDGDPDGVNRFWKSSP